VARVGSAYARTEEVPDPLTLGAGWRRGPLAGSLSEQEDELGDYERLSETGQAIIHAVMRAA
jgi:hypothetical protein